MEFEWDQAKNAINIEKHGVDFDDAREIFSEERLEFLDERKDYGEERTVILGYVRKRVMVAVCTRRPPGTIRIISLRKANGREKERFEKAIKDRSGTD